MAESGCLPLHVSRRIDCIVKYESRSHSMELPDYLLPVHEHLKHRKRSTLVESRGQSRGVRIVTLESVNNAGDYGKIGISTGEQRW